ncbi:MAG TPA: RNA pseudouridine synthase [Polyangiaceae bacterium LLY-WYZ-15_(1-7)]|nr:RNA pseudouridine synthase [Myxococcales bacterium]MBJ70043.1 RNA pseudouridine synthase [Sandaracinus sp.]HJK94461.1 RNA pseudouridine synthase [Polyangiaceae bacterium LLY-WYZ-15_(1-7)]HJL05636.1 RNA pseudouridine synthase [Polyangiaceae bacterium LLY-WYZ-15_(1-7)]HJL08024.1 RNA pseudouridine synthase [Polyangiaceae bacterium LLY-WYZ-15_(1-7)]
MSVEALRILHDAEGLVVVDKPAGLPTTGRDLGDPGCVQHALAAQLRRPVRKVWAVHQLDRFTSGVCLFVRRKALVQVWQAHLRAGRKRYLALVHGVPGWETEQVDAPLRYVKRLGRPAVVEDGKRARTRLARLGAGPAHAWVEARPETGRTHQVRVHLAYVGHPLVGERLHRDPPCTLHPGPALHLARLEAGGQRFEAPLPPALRALADRLDVPRFARGGQGFAASGDEPA